MIELEKWIYSQDIARWLSTRPALSLGEQMDCILSAPHRSLEEKLVGLRELLKETAEQKQTGSGSLGQKHTENGTLGRKHTEGGTLGQKHTEGSSLGRKHMDGISLGQKHTESSSLEQKLLEDKIDAGETLLEVLGQSGGMRNLYEADIFCCGGREALPERRIFTLPGAGLDFIRKQIQETAGRYEIDTKCFFGVLYKYYKRRSRHLVCEWDIILDSEGRIIYCLPEMAADNQENDYWIGPRDDLYMRLPYPTGTVVETVDTPFFRPVKGVVVNQKEPWEEGFVEDNEQWLLYADFLHGGNRIGIGAIKLDHYASATFGADFLLPFVQFLRRHEGETEEREKWLEDLGELLKKDKRYFGMILKDHMPVKTPGIDERCREYVKRLSER